MSRLLIDAFHVHLPEVPEVLEIVSRVERFPGTDLNYRGPLYARHVSTGTVLSILVESKGFVLRYLLRAYILLRLAETVTAVRFCDRFCDTRAEKCVQNIWSFNRYRN